MSQNRIVIFSNGIADFRRSFAVRAGEAARVAIPVRTDHVADVLASLNVYGPVRVVEPPSYRPGQAAEPGLSIDPERALEDLAVRLSGARVVAERAGGSVEGTLVGLHTEPEGKPDERALPRSAVILTADGFARVPLRELTRLRFEEEAVREEIAKALDARRQQIRPGSTVVELALAADEPAEALVQYTVPAAAWKIAYRLRLSRGSAEFQGFAVVDNTTDEDWRDCLISVVTGEPITFSTDLAQSKVPRRGHVDVVKDAAAGAVEVEEALFAMSPAPAGAVMMAGAAAGEDEIEAAGLVPRAARLRESRMVAHRSLADERAAETSEAAVREVGDFCVYESEAPVSIDARRSAAIPVFNVALGGARPILHYKFENHPERPHRSIEFRNETPYSLGRGVCTVYEEGTYAGSCLIPATRPGGDALLPHALETGVRVRHERRDAKSTVVGVRLSAGACYSRVHQARETRYRVRNAKDEAFTLLVDHTHALREPRLTCTVTGADGVTRPLEVKETLAGGVRLSVELGPRADLLVAVAETRVEQTRVAFVEKGARHENLNVRWLQENVLASHATLARDPGVRRCLEIQRSLDAKQQEISDAVGETERLAARQERLRKNIGAGGQDEQTARWRVELGEAETRLRRLEDEAIPALRQEERAIRDELRGALLALTAEWEEGAAAGS